MNPITAGLVGRDLKAGRHEDAASRIRKYISKNFNDADAYLILSECYAAAGDHESAFAAAKSGLAIEPADRQLLIRCARSAYAAGHSREAYELAGRLLESDLDQLPVPRGSLARMIERLTGASPTDAIAGANQESIRDFDWAKRLREKYEKTYSE